MFLDDGDIARRDPVDMSGGAVPALVLDIDPHINQMESQPLVGQLVEYLSRLLDEGERVASIALVFESAVWIWSPGVSATDRGLGKTSGQW